MNKKVTMWMGASVLVVALLVACGASLTAGSMTDEVVATNMQSEVTETVASATAATGLLATNSASHEDADDSVWDSASEVPITLQGASIIVGGDGATVDGSIVTITAAGTYSISGVLGDGQVAVDTEDEGLVRLILKTICQMAKAMSSPRRQTMNRMLRSLAKQTSPSLAMAHYPLMPTTTMALPARMA